MPLTVVQGRRRGLEPDPTACPHARIRYHFRVAELLRSERRDGDLDALRTRVAELEAQLGERSAAVAQLTADLDAFRISYRARVGLLHERLDEIELAIADVELGELSKRVESGTGDGAHATTDPRPDATPQYKSDAIRALFREVARAIHPDLAQDAAARDSRHALMVEANKAYAMGDAEQLRWILQAWERSPEAVQGSDADAIRLRLGRRAAQIEEHLETLASDLETMKASALWQLKTMVDEAAASGKDLIADMVTRLERDIMVATNYLDAIRPPLP
jgi:hypothetical protein